MFGYLFTVSPISTTVLNKLDTKVIIILILIMIMIIIVCVVVVVL